MNNTDRKIFFNFSYFALKLLGKGLYSNPWTAIAELVANGLDAKASQVKIMIDMSDKKSSIVEIFDNGTGMSYEDLAEKYVLIGKNKREDNSLDEELKKNVMGRKGIGKLAALYLSNRYYLLSKTSSESSAWCFDMTAGQDSEIPALNKVDPSQLNIISQAEWDNFETGTMIKLENVDMTNIGIQSIEGLKARLSDYYLLDSIDGKIELAVKYHADERIVFSPIEKNIAFKNFYALFDNSGYNIKGKIQDDVFLASSFDEISAKRRSTVFLDNNLFKLCGEQRFLKEDGRLTDEPIAYQLTGWIGVHASIKKEEAQRNDPSFLKNKAYKSTQLRLYVRKKLAVEDFLPYIKNTQAFANYIEGEISFDILDDNALGDIATSNRQGFAEDDERVSLLIELVKPIVSSLITKRVKIGQEINQEERELKQKAEEERLAAEEERQKAEQEKLEAEIAKDEATKKQKEAEAIANREQKRSQYILNVSEVEDKNIMNSVHSIYNMSNRVKTNLDEINNLPELTSEGRKKLEKASISNQRILSVSKLISKAGRVIDDNDAVKEIDLTAFMVEYVNNVLRCIYDAEEIIIDCIGDVSSSYYVKIKPLSFIMMIDNLIGNAIKANAHKCQIVIDNSNSQKYQLSFKDDGNGIDSSITELSRLFEFGVTTTNGSGLGLYYAKKQMKDLKGNIDIERNGDTGASIVLSWDK